MWEYQWIEVPVGDADRLDQAGLDGWDAVGMTSTGVSFGKAYVGVLLKRRRVIQLSEVAPAVEGGEWADDDVALLLPAAGDRGPQRLVR